MRARCVEARHGSQSALKGNREIAISRQQKWKCFKGEACSVRLDERVERALWSY